MELEAQVVVLTDRLRCTGTAQILVGDVFSQLATLPDASVDCVVTSPPYWGLRDYGTGQWDGGAADCDHAHYVRPRADTPGGRGGSMPMSEHVFREVCGKCGARRVDQQIGLEDTPERYVETIVRVFREVRRVLAAHGTCWVNLGDTYNSRLDGSHGGWNGSTPDPQRTKNDGASVSITAPGSKPKDLVGIPWRVALALQADGWWLRSDIIWSKPNPMPESVTDRPTKAHEYVFLLTKQARYWYDADAVRETTGNELSWDEWNERRQNWVRPTVSDDGVLISNSGDGKPDGGRSHPAGRNLRTVWTIPTHSYPLAHFATYPPALVERCVKAGCPRRVCRTCGKPQERIVDVSYIPAGGRGNEKFLTGAAQEGMQNPGPQGMKYGRANKETTTLGFTDCGHNNYRPGLVLDPFLGSGTTAVVALRNHRDAIGIELNPEYAHLAEKRLARWWEEPRASNGQVDGQLALDGLELELDEQKENARKFTNGRGENEGYAGTNLTSWTYRDATPKRA